MDVWWFPSNEKGSFRGNGDYHRRLDTRGPRHSERRRFNCPDGGAYDAGRLQSPCTSAHGEPVEPCATLVKPSFDKLRMSGSGGSADFAIVLAYDAGPFDYSRHSGPRIRYGAGFDPESRSVSKLQPSMRARAYPLCHCERSAAISSAEPGLVVNSRQYHNGIATNAWRHSRNDRCGKWVRVSP